MARCNSCSAPLPVNSSLCNYCGTRNDLDVLAMRRFAEERGPSHRRCPDCQVPLETIHLMDDGAFAVERCPTCFGLFFDPGEVQAFLQASVAPAFVVNYQQIVNINRERGGQNRPVRYIKCPECGQVMNRVNFGASSGVVMDQCKAHGVWLDNGELIHLMEWRRAGGQILAEQRQKARREERSAGMEKLRPSLPVEDEPDMLGDAMNGLFDSAIRLIGKMFG
jgi:Zn-finger nucleic acid-binding protein